MFKASEVYAGSDGDVTRAYYAELEKRGPLGQIAINLFRAHKCSARAKKYRRRAHKGEAYDRKNWSMGLLCLALEKHAPVDRCKCEVITPSDDNSQCIVCNLPIQSLPITWGWKQDPNPPIGFPWVLYVDLPQGQVSFHSASRGQGPDYQGEWCGEHLSAERIIQFCNEVFSGEQLQKPNLTTEPRRHGEEVKLVGLSTETNWVKERFLNPHPEPEDVQDHWIQDGLFTDVRSQS